MNTISEMTILAIDDDPVSLRFIEKLLNQGGYGNIRTCTNAEEGCRMVEKEPPDLILLDIVMPDMDGYQFSMRVRENASTRDLPILVVTGGAAEANEAIEKSFEAGATDFITKPINTTEFFARVRSALAIKQAHDRLKEELSRRQQAEEEKETLIAELKDAFAKVKKLTGLLPICASCKKIRDDQGYWNQIENYIREHSEAEFSHSLCPECVESIYPGMKKPAEKTP
jgi:PleD family two-component response regulator